MKETLDRIDSPAINWPIGQRLAMVALGYLPMILVIVIVMSAILMGRRFGVGAGIGGGVLALYLLPPAGCRLSSLCFSPRVGRHPVSSPAFLRWWFSAQWQVIFNRLPFLEELLRLFPGLYSLWLRLWGAKIGSIVYWSPGVLVLDRPFVNVGSRVVFGAGVRLNPHVIVPGKGRDAQLWLAPVLLGDDSLIGGYSLITAGAIIPSGVSVPAGRHVRPFCTWQDNEPAHFVAEE